MLLLASVWRSIVGATDAEISGKTPDPDVASFVDKEADVLHPSASSQLKNFLYDLKVYASF